MVDGQSRVVHNLIAAVYRIFGGAARNISIKHAVYYHGTDVVLVHKRHSLIANDARHFGATRNIGVTIAVDYSCHAVKSANQAAHIIGSSNSATRGSQNAAVVDTGTSSGLFRHGSNVSVTCYGDVVKNHVAHRGILHRTEQRLGQSCDFLEIAVQISAKVVDCGKTTGIHILSKDIMAVWIGDFRKRGNFGWAADGDHKVAEFHNLSTVVNSSGGSASQRHPSGRKVIYSQCAITGEKIQWLARIL